MARYTIIQCGCGAKLNTNIDQQIELFDSLHGSEEHQKKVLEIKLLNAQTKANK